MLASYLRTGPETRAFFPRRAEEAEMNMLGRAFHTVRVWTGLADASESHLTPEHGWLLPTPADARRQRKDSDDRREARRLMGVRA